MELHKAIKQAVEGKGIPISNIIGFSSDTCNVMFGKCNSLTTLMSKDILSKVGSRVSSKSSRTQSEVMSHKKKSIKNSFFLSGKNNELHLFIAVP